MERLIPAWFDASLRAAIDALTHARTDRILWDRAAIKAALADERREAARAAGRGGVGLARTTPAAEVATA